MNIEFPNNKVTGDCVALFNYFNHLKIITFS